MTRDEMHIVFRTLGQQMGLQQIRGILPESIDVYLNVAQTEIVRNIINSHLNVNYKEKISQTDNSISPINSLRNLYKQVVTNFDKEGLVVNDYYKHIINQPEDINVMIYTSIEVDYGHDIKRCRLVNRDDLGKILNDYCNKPSKEYPVASFIENHFEVFTDNNWNSINIHYIKNPVKIGDNSDCELNEYLHTSIVELAVNKFLTSIRNTSQPQTQQ